MLGAWAGNSFVPGLSIEGVSGSLLTRLKVDKLEWVDGGSTLLEGIELETGRPDFSKNLVNIDSLNIDSISIASDENARPRKRGELVNIGDFGTAPVNLLIASGQLKTLKITDGATTLFQLNELVLDGTSVQDNQLLLKDASASVQIPDQPTIALTIPALSMDMLEPHEFTLDSDARMEHPRRWLSDIERQGIRFAAKLSTRRIRQNSSP